MRSPVSSPKQSKKVVDDIPFPHSRPEYELKNEYGFDFSMIDYNSSTTPTSLGDSRERAMSEYTAKVRIKIERNITRALEDFEDFELEGGVKIFEQHRVLANKICTALADRTVINVMAIGEPQTGKTSCMYATVKLYLECGMNKEHPIPIIPIENIYFITGLSSCEWVAQTKKRFPEVLEKNIYHRGNLKAFITAVSGKHNVMIIIDEIQYKI